MGADRGGRGGKGGILVLVLIYEYAGMGRSRE